MAPFFRLYNTFQNSYEKAQVVLTRCEANEVFSQLLDVSHLKSFSIMQIFKYLKNIFFFFKQKIEKEAKVKVRTVKAATKLENLLIQVIQRIPRWILLLNECASKTPAGHPDSQYLPDAASALDRVVSYLNEDITSSEQREKFLNMRTKLKGVDVSNFKLVSIQ